MGNDQVNRNAWLFQMVINGMKYIKRKKNCYQLQCENQPKNTVLEQQ